MRSPLTSPAQVEGTLGLLPQPEKDLERTSSTRLEARFPYHGSRAMMRSLSPSHGDPTSLAPHERLTDHAVVPLRNRTLGPPLENNPETPPSSRDEGLRLLHGLETNSATSLQTPQEA